MSKGRKGLNLFLRIAVGCAFLVLTSMVVILYFTIDKSSAVLEKEAINNLKILNEEKTSRIDLAFSDLKTFNESFSYNPAVIDYASGNSIEQPKVTRFFTEVISRTHKLYENIFLDLNGVIQADGLNGKSIGFKLLTGGVYSGKKVIQDNVSMIANPQLSPITGRQVILILSPVRGADQKAIAVVSSAIDLRVVADDILANNEANNNAKTKTYLIDKTGIVLSSNDESAILNLDFSKTPQLQSFYTLMQNNNTVTADIVIDEVSYKATASQTSLGGFLLVSAVPTQVYMQKVSTLQNSILLIMLFASLFCVLGITAIVYKITNPLLKRLLHAMNVAENIASNDLHTNIVIDGNDEGTRLLIALNKMQLDLRNTISSVVDSAKSLNSMATNLNEQSCQSMGSLQQQTINIESIATAVNELSVVFEEVERNSASAVDICSEGINNTDRGSESVTKTLISIESLANELNESSISVTSLVELLNKIGSVIGVIRSIAEQTNLLALNAAIESARAGESGRGFAVVADEVRQLAHRTADSTVEIEQLITDVQKQSKKVSDTMSQCNSNAINTVDVARTAGDALEKISEAMSRINEANFTIATATKQQSVAVQEIDQNLTGIKTVSEETLNNNVETNQSSEQLKELANSIELDVCRFKF